MEGKTHPEYWPYFGTSEECGLALTEALKQIFSTEKKENNNGKEDV